MEISTQQHLWITNPERYLRGDKPSVYLTDHNDMKDQGWSLISSHDIVIAYDLPSQDFLRTEEIRKLQDTIKEVDAKAYAAKMELQKRINDLLMIGHDTVEDHV